MVYLYRWCVERWDEMCTTCGQQIINYLWQCLVLSWLCFLSINRQINFYRKYIAILLKWVFKECLGTCIQQCYFLNKEEHKKHFFTRKKWHDAVIRDRIDFWHGIINSWFKGGCYSSALFLYSLPVSIGHCTHQFFYTMPTHKFCFLKDTMTL